MSVVGRWCCVLLLMQNMVVREKGVAQSADPGCDASSRSDVTLRLPGQWLPPLPHLSGNDDPGLYTTGLLIPDSVRWYWQAHASSSSSKAAILPTSIDWSGYDSPVKYQGSCGACWAFATVAAIENAGAQSDLSEQVLISCSGAGTCSGGFYDNALKYVRSYGLPCEECDPYTATNGDCSSKSANPPFLERLRSIKTSMWGETARINDLRNALQTGPVIVSMLVFADFNAYRGGIYRHSSGDFKGYHAVLVVGYNDSLSCFKVKNSWGIYWGESGYCRVSYDDVSSSVNFGGYGAQVLGAYAEYLATGIEPGRLAQGYSLEQNWPNPFNPLTTIKYTVGGTRPLDSFAQNAQSLEIPPYRAGGQTYSTIKLVVYDVLGREVATVVNGSKAPGSYEVQFNGSGFASGLYIYRLMTEGSAVSRMMVLIK
jgi:hypothetical protein